MSEEVTLCSVFCKSFLPLQFYFLNVKDIPNASITKIYNVSGRRRKNTAETQKLHLEVFVLQKMLEDKPDQMINLFSTDKVHQLAYNNFIHVLNF